MTVDVSSFACAWIRVIDSATVAMVSRTILIMTILNMTILEMSVRIERFSPLVEIDWDFPCWLAKVNLSRSDRVALIASGRSGTLSGLLRESSRVGVDFPLKINFLRRVLKRDGCVRERGTPPLTSGTLVQHGFCRQ